MSIGPGGNKNSGKVSITVTSNLSIETDLLFV